MFRSLIFVPGNSTRFIEKARTLNADIICFDLEDSVPANEKDSARKRVSEALSRYEESSGQVYARINSPESGLVAEDLKALVKKGLDGVVIPKVNTVDEIMKIVKQVAKLEKQRVIEIAIMPSIETAKGVVNAHSIANADDRINALVFGVFDFLYDMRLDYDDKDSSGFAYARAKIPVDARAAGIPAIDAIWQKIDDVRGLVEDATMAKRLGYFGKCVIHPTQIGPVHSVFLPSKGEVEWAKKVVLALGEAVERGRGRGAVKLEGKMIDAVHYKQARAILEAAGRL